MKIKATLLFFLMVFSTLVMADTTSSGGLGLSLAPPITDSSVIYLSNLFGVVDGVLSGTGSQIMGSMMSVFNSAVLALGGIVIMYTVLVGTMNTAQDGSALGEKWSSIWIPMRSTVGLALLMPKASGYCVMQIFVMWVIVQGVGAADLVWNAALNYLNRGGVIIQQQQSSPIASLTGGSSEISAGALNILTGQVCMLGIQNYLTSLRQTNVNNASVSGPCYDAAKQSDTTSMVAGLCNNAVPNFIGSVNLIAVESANTAATKYSVQLPNFDASVSPYNTLNGICGVITWNAFTVTPAAEALMGAGADTDTVALSRAIALQQMYSDLSSIAQRMVNNSPDLSQSTSGTCPGFAVTTTSGNKSGTSACFSEVAVSQYGVPYLSSTATVCTTPSTDCQKWGSDPSISSAPLFLGTEFQGAVADYNGIMLPSLNLMVQANSGSTADDTRAFIAGAQSSGWIMAGSYFYKLAQINGQAIDTSGSSYSGTANLVDSNTGMTTTNKEPSTLASCIVTTSGNNHTCDSGSSASCYLCQMISNSVTYTDKVATAYNLSSTSPEYLNAISGLVDGTGVLTNPVPAPTFQSSTQKAVDGTGSSTVNGFVGNSSLISIPTQPGLAAPSFALHVNVVIGSGPYMLQSKSVSCGRGTTWTGCIGSAIGDSLYNGLVVGVVNGLLNTIVTSLNAAVLIFISLPLQAIAVVFQQGMVAVQQPGSNPILALAQMGCYYINTSMELWIYIIEISLVTSLIPIFGIVIFVLISLCLPLMIAWMGVMTSIGFTTAYYIPFVPYMNFLFGSMAWFMAVIEAMVAAPLIALGVANPEGHEAFGKGESSIMILLNVFLRPALMVIGLITAISLTYVSVWVINEGFENAVSFMGSAVSQSGGLSANSNYSTADFTNPSVVAANNAMNQKGNSWYNNWASVYAFFFAVLMYTTLYLTVVQNSFNLIYQLPDKVLRWIGGGDNAGQEAAQWKQEAKGQMDAGAKATEQAGGAMQKQLGGLAEEGISAAKGKGGGGGKATASQGPPAAASQGPPAA